MMLNVVQWLIYHQNLLEYSIISTCGYYSVWLPVDTTGKVEVALNGGGSVP